MSVAELEDAPDLSSGSLRVWVQVPPGILRRIFMVTIDMDKTGKKIKEIRKRSGMTIKQVQDACGISAAAVCKWQNGQAMPTLDNLIILSDLWNVKMDDLIVRQVS